MEQFNLDKWLKDKSRKIVTRDGREVTIEKTDIHIHGMSHMILGKYSDIYEIWHSNGRINYTGSDCNLDLFFADEEEEFTEFDKCLLSAFYSVAIKAVTTNGTASFQENVDEWSKPLLDLARKEILKDLPKWKKSNSFFNTGNKFELGKTSLRRFDGYEIPYSELEKLPKEE